MPITNKFNVGDIVSIQGKVADTNHDEVWVEITTRYNVSNLCFQDSHLKLVKRRAPIIGDTVGPANWISTTGVQSRYKVIGVHEDIAWVLDQRGCRYTYPLENLVVVDPE
jgi:hypothetical protein